MTHVNIGDFLRGSFEILNCVVQLACWKGMNLMQLRYLHPYPENRIPLGGAFGLGHSPLSDPPQLQYIWACLISRTDCKLACGFIAGRTPQTFRTTSTPQWT